MKESEELSFLDIFGQPDEPHIERNKRHPMPEILLLTLCAVIGGSEGWNDIERFGWSKLDFLRQYLAYPNGIPSDETLKRFFRAINSNNGRVLKEGVRWLVGRILP